MQEFSRAGSAQYTIIFGKDKSTLDIWSDEL